MIYLNEKSLIIESDDLSFKREYELSMVAKYITYLFPLHCWWLDKTRRLDYSEVGLVLDRNANLIKNPNSGTIEKL